MQQKNPVNPLIGLITVLTMTLTFSCSSDNGGGDDPNNEPGTPTSCGTRTEVFDSKLYECRTGDKIYLKTPVSYQEKNYEAVLIGSQTWMAENLSYNAPGSKCHSEDPTCAKYGRFYDWATAMGLNASCNESSCASQISEKHKGVCPSGWHIPNSSEWDALLKYVKEDNGNDYAMSKYLKATNITL
jgi:hypothetical protein